MCLPAGPSGRQAPAHSATQLTDGAASQAESPLKGKTVVIIGAGGAGRALVFGAAHAGAHVVIANRCRAVQCCAAALHLMGRTRSHRTAHTGQADRKRASIVPGLAPCVCAKQVFFGAAFLLLPGTISHA